MKIPFNRPYTTGKEIQNIKDAIKNGHLSGNGNYTKMCHDFFKTKYGFKKTLLTTSCTDALCAILLKSNLVINNSSILFFKCSLLFDKTENNFADFLLKPNIDVQKKN